MTPVLIFIAFELGLGLGAGVALWLAAHRVGDIPEENLQPDVTPDSWLEQVTLRRIVVHTKDDKSIEGLLTLVGADGVTLRSAKLLGRQPTDLAGEVYLPRESVLFVQMAPEAQVIALPAVQPVAVAVP